MPVLTFKIKNILHRIFLVYIVRVHTVPSIEGQNIIKELDNLSPKTNPIV